MLMDAESPGDGTMVRNATTRWADAALAMPSVAWVLALAVVLSVATSHAADGAEPATGVVQKSDASTRQHQNRQSGKYDLHVTVIDGTWNLPEEGCAKLERAIATASEKQMEEAFTTLFFGKGPAPASNATVLLRGYAFGDDCLRQLDSGSYAERCSLQEQLWKEGIASNGLAAAGGEWVYRQGVTDADGKITFPGGWARGIYEVSASAHSIPAEDDTPRTAVGKKTILLVPGGGSHIRLSIHASPIAVTGRIVDARGRPVAGATVTGTPVPFRERGEWWRRLMLKYQHPVTTVSDAHGVYVLPGFTPPDPWRTFGYLCGGDPTEGGLNPVPFFAEIHAQADGFVYDWRAVTNVALVTESHAAPFRRVQDVFLKSTQPEIQAMRDGIRKRTLHACDGNTITDVDIALNHPLPRSRVAGVLEDTKGRAGTNRVLAVRSVGAGPPRGRRIHVRTPVDEPGSIETDEHGVFAIPSVAPGRYAITVHNRDGNTTLQRPITGGELVVEPGTPVTGHRVVINPPEDFTICGHVRDAEGGPVVGVQVRAKYQNSCDYWLTYTDKDGAYYVDGLDGTGHTSLDIRVYQVPGGNFGGVILHDVPVNTTNANVVIPAAGSIEGTVRDAITGDVVTNYNVTVPVVRLQQEGTTWERLTIQVTRSPAGGFRIARVPAGEATVQIRAPGFETGQFDTIVKPGEPASVTCAMEKPKKK